MGIFKWQTGRIKRSEVIMIKINQIKVNISSDDKALENKIRKLLRLDKNITMNYKILRRSIDARKKDNLMYIYSVEVKLPGMNEASLVKKLNNKDIMLTNEEEYIFPETKETDSKKKVVIAGLGPSGLFAGLFLARAGYLPEIFERGASVHERTKIVNAFWETGELDVSTNVQFGEGGAGTFSDGKLNSVIKEKAGRIRKVLETLVEFGAPEDILYNSKPHVGTDILSLIVSRIREEIIRLGGIVHFNSCVSDIHIENNRIKAVRINDEHDVETDVLILAPGHSARDTFEMLLSKDVPMEQKAFAVGMRVEHPQSLINRYMYGTDDNGSLPVADYKVTAQADNGRGVYSFCMCPGGYVVNASSEKEMLCVNGMSYSKRDGVNANSAIVVTVNPEDFGSNEILAGMKFQRGLEKAAYKAGNGKVPYQLNEDFVKGNKSISYGKVAPQIKGCHTGGNLREVLPEIISQSVIDGMKSFDKIIQGFNMPEAVFSGVESRTSSPVRILRNDFLESPKIRGLYPCGEGAGYAGGITSAAVDGIKVAEAVATAD